MPEPRYRPAPQRTTLSFAFSYVDRALHEGLAKRKFGADEMGEIAAFFGSQPLQCVYCGSTEVTRWDHLVAVMKGGETVLGNMVPACQKCDDSKRDLAFDEWMQSDSPSSPRSRGIADVNARIELIHA